jgi:hypothetical protein
MIIQVGELLYPLLLMGVEAGEAVQPLERDNPQIIIIQRMDMVITAHLIQPTEVVILVGTPRAQQAKTKQDNMMGIVY